MDLQQSGSKPRFNIPASLRNWGRRPAGTTSLARTQNIKITTWLQCSYATECRTVAQVCRAQVGVHFFRMSTRCLAGCDSTCLFLRPPHLVFKHKRVQDYSAGLSGTHFFRMSARCLAGCDFHFGNTESASAIAARVSEAPALGTLASTSCVAGFSTCVFITNPKCQMTPREDVYAALVAGCMYSVECNMSCGYMFDCW